MVKLDWHQTVDFVRKDWDKNPTRLTLETVNWLLNIVIAGTVSATVPHTDWSVVYPVIFVAIGISIYSAISRGSFGLLMTSLTLLIIDSIGYYRILVL
jgi:hypothetical protein